jgi:hypothetical protein
MAEGSRTNRSKGPLVLSILIVALGIGDLLTAKGFFPGIDWAWTIGLAAVGLLTFVLSGGIDKVSVVVGTFLIASSVLSVLRQTDQITQNVEVPLLVIAIGVLIFIAQLGIVPAPRWLVWPPANDDNSRSFKSKRSD